MSFHVLEENDHSFKIKHPDGSHFLVAKAGLDDKVMKKIKGYATGGAVEGGAGPDSSPDPFAEDTSEGMAAKGASQMSDMALAQNMRAREDFKNAQSQAKSGNYGPLGDFGTQAAMGTIGAVRPTSAGNLIGTVGEDALKGGDYAVQKDLLNQAAQGNAMDLAKNGSGLAMSSFQPKPEPSMLDRVKARYGDDISEAKWNSLQKQAQKANYSYIPIDIKGKHSGVLPNFDATATGEIGDPKNFGTLNTSKIFRSDPFNWYDQKYGASKALLQKHLDAGIPANITTASDLIAHDDYVSKIPRGSTVNMVVTQPIGVADAMHEGPMPSNKRMLAAADKLRQDGINVKVSVPTSSGKLKELDPFSVKRLTSDYNAHYRPSEE